MFGVSDGLVSNVALILGVAGASSGQEIVRIAGLAGLIAGAVSMAAGEYISMQAQRELLERELEMERREHVRNPEHEVEELAEIYESRGMDADTAREMATNIMDDPEKALEVHAREEMGIDPNELGNPVFARHHLVLLLRPRRGAAAAALVLRRGQRGHRGVDSSRGGGRSAGWKCAGAGHQPVDSAGLATSACDCGGPQPP